MLTAAAEAACWCTAIGRTAGGAAGRPSGVGSRRRTGVVPAASVSTFRPQELKGPKTAPLPVENLNKLLLLLCCILLKLETDGGGTRCAGHHGHHGASLYLILSYLQIDWIDIYLSIYLSYLHEARPGLRTVLPSSRLRAGAHHRWGDAENQRGGSVQRHRRVQLCP